jgi:hypothetical protein
MEYLRPFLIGYLGVPVPALHDSNLDAPKDDLSTMFLLQRCSCSVINLVVKAGLDPIRTYVDDFRTTITFLNASNQRIAACKRYCMSISSVIACNLV